MSSQSGRHVIVLAAGAGRRFGGGKLTATWRGEPLIRATVRTALAADVERVTVVTGADADLLAEALSEFDDTRLKIVQSPDWAEGMAASLRSGIEALPQSTQAVVVFLGDMPLIPPALADRLLDAVVRGAPAATVRSSLGPAHPVAFSASVFPQLSALHGDRGARSVLKDLGDAVVHIHSDDPGVVLDVDLPGDLERLSVDRPSQMRPLDIPKA